MKITDQVFIIESAKRAHSFLLIDESPLLIDTGMPGNAEEVLAEINTLGVSASSITDILLTHYDVDHAGNVDAIQEMTSADVWISRKDEPYLMNREKRHGIKRYVNSLLKPRPPAHCNVFDRNTFGGVEIIPAPGHTPGHCMFLYDGVLFSGDIITAQRGRLGVMSNLMNWDADMLRSSLAGIADISFEWLCPSHGSPVRNDAQLQEFIEREGACNGSNR